MFAFPWHQHTVFSVRRAKEYSPGMNHSRGRRCGRIHLRFFHSESYSVERDVIGIHFMNEVEKAGGGNVFSGCVKTKDLPGPGLQARASAETVGCWP